jgi:hypothetical protein
MTIDGSGSATRRTALLRTAPLRSAIRRGWPRPPQLGGALLRSAPHCGAPHRSATRSNGGGLGHPSLAGITASTLGCLPGLRPHVASQRRATPRLALAPLRNPTGADRKVGPSLAKPTANDPAGTLAGALAPQRVTAPRVAPLRCAPRHHASQHSATLRTAPLAHRSAPLRLATGADRKVGPSLPDPRQTPHGACRGSGPASHRTPAPRFAGLRSAMQRAASRGFAPHCPASLRSAPQRGLAARSAPACQIHGKRPQGACRGFGPTSRCATSPRLAPQRPATQRIAPHRAASQRAAAQSNGGGLGRPSLPAPPQPPCKVAAGASAPDGASLRAATRLSASHRVALPRAPAQSNGGGFGHPSLPAPPQTSP